MDTLRKDLGVVELTEAGEVMVGLPAGTRIRVDKPKFEWLCHEGMYAEISVPSMTGRKFRVRVAALKAACNEWASPHPLIVAPRYATRTRES